MNKQKEEGVKENLNNTIWNLTARVLSKEEYQVLHYDLNHGLPTCQKSDIVASVESVWDQINKKNICKEKQNQNVRSKNWLRALTCSHANLDNSQVFKGTLSSLRQFLATKTL